MDPALQQSIISNEKAEEGWEKSFWNMDTKATNFYYFYGCPFSSTYGCGQNLINSSQDRKMKEKELTCLM